MRDKKTLMTHRKEMQENMSRRKTFEISIGEFLDFRNQLEDIYHFIFDNADDEDYIAMPLSTDKTIAYYIYHLMRIEDITLHSLILDENQVFHSQSFKEKLGIDISTTGNELDRQQIIEFSRQIDVEELKNYVHLVYKKTNEVVSQMSYDEIRTKVSEERRESL